LDIEVRVLNFTIGKKLQYNYYRNWQYHEKSTAITIKRNSTTRE